MPATTRHLLTDRADVLVETFAPDGFGEPVAETSLESSSVPCLVRPLNSEALTLQGRDASRRMSRLYFAARPFPEDDARSRLLRIGDRTYRPVDVHNLNSLDRLWQVDCELVTG